jgi:hypothetical protein
LLIQQGVNTPKVAAKIRVNHNSIYQSRRINMKSHLAIPNHALHRSICVALTVSLALAVETTLPSAVALAKTPSSCVELAQDDAGVALRNACNETIYVSFCVDNDRSPYRCNGVGGATTLRPGRQDHIESYRSTGGGRVEWAACVYPETPIGWRPGRQYRCG